MVKRSQAATTEPPAHFKVDQDFCKQIPQIVEKMLDKHATHKTWTPELAEELVDQYIKALDPQKTTFLSSDVEDIRAHLGEAFQRVRGGNCADLAAINDWVLQRMGENTDFARRFLGSKYKLDKKATIQTDVTKRSFAKTQKDKEAVLSQDIHFRVAEYLRDGMSLDEAKKKIVHAYELSAKHFAGQDFLELGDSFLDSVGLSLDPHTTYFSPAEMEEFKTSMTNSFGGIGAALSSQEGYPSVESLVPGGAAELGGRLKPGDQIIGVTQDGEKMVSTLDMDLDDVTSLIRGPEGTSVILTVQRKGKGGTEKLEIAIVRKEIKLEESDAAMKIEEIKIAGEGGVERQVKIATIDLPSFYGDPTNDRGNPDTKSSARDFKKLLEEAKGQHVDGLVIDLSKNLGGLLSEVVKIAGYFIHTGAIVKIGVAEGPWLEVLNDRNTQAGFSGPVVINVSSWSASASEILAGALKSYDRAVVVGDKTTYGKGTVQHLNFDEKLGSIKVTTDFFFVPDGYSTQHRGVESDIPIPSLRDNDEIGERYYENSLVPPGINPFVTKAQSYPDNIWGNMSSLFSIKLNPNPTIGSSRYYDPITDEQRQELKRLSQARVSQSAEFQEIERRKQEEIEDSASDGVVKLADHLESLAEAEAPADDDDIDPDLQLNEAKRILVDLIQLQQRATQEGAKKPVISAP